MLNNSIIGLLGDSENMKPLDIPLPEEILDIIISNLGEKDLTNLIKVVNERIKHCTNRRLKKLLWIKSKLLNKTIILITITSFSIYQNMDIL